MLLVVYFTKFIDGKLSKFSPITVYYCFFIFSIFQEFILIKQIPKYIKECYNFLNSFKIMNKKILKHFKKYDPVLHSYGQKIGTLPPIKKDRPENYFFRLSKEIICQQLSNKAGNAIFGRFQKLFPQELVQPLDILSISHTQLRATGMSNAKARYVRNLAEEITHGDLQVFHYEVMADEEIIADLIRVKGIGRWTAEMFLMFTLGREDVFSYGDLGLKKGLMKIYALKKEPTKTQIEEIVAKWSPYKSYGSRILWESLENK